MNTQKQRPEDISYWDNRQNKITTKIGKWIGGDRVDIRGLSLLEHFFNHGERPGESSLIQLQVLNVTGRMISRELACWIENNLKVFCYPDARIWCNQIGVFSANMGTSPTAATVAGALAADSRVYGSQTAYKAMQFIKDALVRKNNGEDVRSIVESVPKRQGKPALLGFVRPVAKDDERIAPHRKMTKDLGFDIGEHMALANEMAKYMEEKYGTGINIGGYTAAFLADQGFSPEELYYIRCISVANGVTACYTDNLNDADNAFLPLKCKDINYEGPAIRALNDNII